MGSRVIHVPRRFAQDVWGGTESVILNLCRQQLKAALEPEIHTSLALSETRSERWNGIPIRRYAYTYPYFGLSRDERHAMDLKAGNLISLPLFGSLLRLPDVRLFHAHVIGRMGGEVLCAARLKRRPCVVTLHGNVFDVPDAERGDSYGPAGGRHFEWGKAFGMLFRSRRLLEEADAVLCVGYSEYVAARKALSHERVHYLANGVNPEAFEHGDRHRMRGELGIADDEFVFACISRIDPQKGQHLLVEALGKLASAGLRAKLLLAGRATDLEYRDRLRESIAHLGLQERVSWLDPVSPESARHADSLAASDAFVLPSRHEPFGIVVLEAWAAGKPVIVSNVGGLQRLVDGGKDGLVFDSGDGEGLAAQMVTLLQDSAMAESLAAAGRSKMLAKYTWDRVAEDLERIYRKAEAARA